MTVKIPETYIANDYLARLMADAELQKFKSATMAAEAGYFEEARRLFGDVNKAGFDAANRYVEAAMVVHEEEYGICPDSDIDMFQQVQAGRDVISSQVIRSLFDLITVADK